MVQESKGLTRAREIYHDRSRRARELKARGKKVVGYTCIYPPLEILTALDLVPYRIFGDIRESITEADRGLPTVFCPFMRSCLDITLKGKYDFLDGMILIHACDAQEKTAHVWESLISYPYIHFIDVPTTVHKPSQEYFMEGLKNFKKTLESFTGKELSPKKLRTAIEAHNQQRALVKELYDSRKLDPPLISGQETLRVMVALMSIPVEEGNELLRQVISEVKEGKNAPDKKPARLLIWGSVIDNTSYLETIEGAGANVVMDDICEGTRFYWEEVELTKDLLDDLVQRYLVRLKGPRTYFDAVYAESSKDYMSDLESRFGYMKDYIDEWDVNGVILQSLKYCDCHGFEAPQVKDYLDRLGVPNTYIEHDYSEGSLASLMTRVQALVEMITSGNLA